MERGNFYFVGGPLNGTVVLIERNSVGWHYTHPRNSNHPVRRYRRSKFQISTKGVKTKSTVDCMVHDSVSDLVAAKSVAKNWRFIIDNSDMVGRM